MKHLHNAADSLGPQLWELGYVDGIQGRPMRYTLIDCSEYRSGWYTGHN